MNKLAQAEPANPGLWKQALQNAKARFIKWPSPVGSAWAVKWYNSNGGTWVGQQTRKQRTGFRANFKRHKATLNMRRGQATRGGASQRVKMPRMPKPPKAAPFANKHFTLPRMSALGTSGPQNIRPIRMQPMRMQTFKPQKMNHGGMTNNRVPTMRKHAQLKFAGGPGSGTDVNNTDVITHLAQSKIVSLNNRRFVLATPPHYISNRIPVLKIKFAGQRNYSIVKLGKMLTSNDWVQKKVDLLEDANGFFHVIDGHHRVLAAIRRGHTYVNARVWTSDLSQPIEKTGANILRVLKAAKGTSAGPSYQNLGMAAAGLAGAGGIYYLRDKGVLPKTKKGDRPNFESMM